MVTTRTAGVGISTGAMVLVGLIVPATVAGPAHAGGGPTPGTFTWERCPVKEAPTARCGRIILPRDYSRPNGRTVALAAAKVPATGVKRGTLFFNPGGPAESGVEQVAGGIADSLPTSVRRHFDFISWDPRGVGLSRPSIQGCTATTPEPSPLPTTGLPTRSQWFSLLSQSRSQARAAARQCLPQNLGIAPYMGTNNVVRDLDMMRQAVGDDKLTFWGASYGSRIGYVYALRYPDRLRAILLDGPIDPRRGYRDFARVRAQATDRALTVMATPQVRPGFAAEIIATRDDLRINGPVAVPGTEGQLDQWTFQRYVAQQASAQSQWTKIQELIDAIDQVRNPKVEAADEQASDEVRDVIEEVAEDDPFSPQIGNGGKGADDAANRGMANRIINYLDYADGDIPGEVARRILLNNVRNFPFNAANTAGLLPNAAGLTSLEPDPIPLTRTPRFARIARAAENVLISGSTGDGATPAPWMAQMAASFRRAGLVRFDGWQHVNWINVESSCVNDPITDFIVTGTKPDPNRPPLCPFAPPGPPESPL